MYSGRAIHSLIHEYILFLSNQLDSLCAFLVVVNVSLRIINIYINEININNFLEIHLIFKLQMLSICYSPLHIFNI